MGGNLMSLEDDILASQQELIAKSQKSTPFMGTVTSADPLQVVVDGTSVPLPAMSFTSSQLSSGQRVAVLPVGTQYVVLGAVGDYAAPPTAPVSMFGAVLTADLAYGTTATQILSVALDIGTYAIHAHAGWTLVGATDQFFQMNFSGTAVNHSYDFVRYTASANAGSFANAFAAESNLGQTTPQALNADGMLVVTAAGNLTYSMRRTAGTSALAKKGSFITAQKVA